MKVYVWKQVLSDHGWGCAVVTVGDSETVEDARALLIDRLSNERTESGYGPMRFQQFMDEIAAEEPEEVAATGYVFFHEGGG
jgi:hypothetical protein